MRTIAASGLDQVQQVVDPDNSPSPQDDQLPDGVAFPIDPAFSARWVTGPGGAQPSAGQHEAARDDRTIPQETAQNWGHQDALSRSQPIHKAEWQYSPQRHGDCTRAYNNTADIMHGMVGRPAMTRQEYASKTGRPDLHNHYLEAYARGRQQHSSQAGPYGSEGLAAAASIERTADAWSQPRQSTDDLHPVPNSPQTTPPMQQPSGDYEAGRSAGQADKATGQRPAFADNSSGVSPYVKGYAEGYGAPGPPQGAQDVPYSMGGDSGQGLNAQQAQQAVQVARASRRRVSAAFAPDRLLGDPEFRKGYLFASKWQPGQRLVAQGSARFEAGMYAGVTDRPEIQGQWLLAHINGHHEILGRRLALHRSFTAKMARRQGLPSRTAYLRQAATSTDLITDGPGTSPDPLGSTPLNGPGTAPPMGGMDNANAPGGAPPYQGAPPLPGGPVAPDDVMGKPQQKPVASGPFTNTFSGAHPENADLAPVAPNSAAQPGYSNPGPYQGDPHHHAKLAAFRARVQAGLAQMGEF